MLSRATSTDHNDEYASEIVLAWLHNGIATTALQSETFAKPNLKQKKRSL